MFEWGNSVIEKKNTKVAFALRNTEKKKLDIQLRSRRDKEIVFGEKEKKIIPNFLSLLRATHFLFILKFLSNNNSPKHILTDLSHK